MFTLMINKVLLTAVLKSISVRELRFCKQNPVLDILDCIGFAVRI